MGTRWLLICLMALNLTAQSPSNGVNGGYQGSDLWFARMRQSAANQALLLSLGGRTGAGSKSVPASYVEFAGVIEFPGGNPFPAKRLPDLRIRCKDVQADRVERAPHVDADGAFYSVLKRGLSYEVCWMYTFGGKEAFATLEVGKDAVSPMRRSIVYVPKPAPAKPASPVSTRVPEPVMESSEANRFDLSAFPEKPTTFEEQIVADAIRTATSPFTKATAHDKLARYYQRKGETALAAGEEAKARYWRNQK